MTAFRAGRYVSVATGWKFRSCAAHMKTMNASNARKAFAQVLAAVVSSDEPVIIVRYNQPIAALVPIGRLLPAERGTLQKRKARVHNGTARVR